MSNINYNPRAFGIEKIAWGPHELTCVSLESQAHYLKQSDPVVHPPDWVEQVEPYVDTAEIVFMTYFPPEVERNTYHVPVLGRLAATFAKQDLSVYRQMTELAAEHKKPVAVADIASRMGYVVRELTLPNALFIGCHKGPANPEITKIEQIIPTPTDARRVFTARGIRQVADSRPDGASMLYVAAPAHVRRVRKYITQDPTLRTERRFQRYKQVYRKLDTATRIYNFIDGKWELVEQKEIQ